MAAMAWKLLIFSFLLQSSARCDDNVLKSSLVFVIDDTGSMEDVISSVKRYAKQIFDTVINTEASQIESFTLVTFNDPYIGVPTTVGSRDQDTFKRALDAISVYGGGDCPEYSLSGIKRALEVSLPRSNLFVFTDASAKDYDKYEEVKNLAQEKSSQIDFIIHDTGRCLNSYSRNLPDFLVYHDLANATSGQVFEPSGNIDEILIYVKEIIKGRMTELSKGDFPPGQDNKLFYPVDQYTGDVHISAIGDWPKIHVTDPEGFKPPTTDIVKKPKISVVKVQTTKTGTFTVTVGSTSNTNVVVKGRTTIDFQHGFSTITRSTIEGTSTKPQPDVKSHLYIDLNVMKGADVKLTDVQLLDLDGKVLLEQTLDEINTKDRLYITAPFEPPKQMFRIMVSGHVVANNNPVKRLSTTPIEPESVRPQIVLDHGKTEYTALARDDVLRIPCHATGYPKPTITWKADGINIKSGPKYSFEEGTLVVRSPNVYDNRAYTCAAKNILGEDSKTFNGIVEARPQILLDHGKTEYTALARDDVLSIPCRVTGYPKPTITWKADGKIINSDSKYHIEEGRLVIRSPNVYDNRAYTCIGTNKLGEDIKTFKGIVEAKPIILLDNGKTKYTALEDDRVLRIPCRVVGFPKPVITWKVDGTPIKSDSKYSVVEDALLVRSPVISDSNEYTCVATNKLGEDAKIFTGIVEDDITSYDKIHTIYVPTGTTYKLDCLVPHSDSDTVMWFHDPPIVNNTRTTKSFHLLDTNVSESGNYSCRVSNEDGYTMDTYDVIFGYPPNFKVYQENEFIDWTGNDFMDCSVDAEPIGKVQWFHEGKPIRDDDYQLKVPAWGQYICNVSNAFGSVQRHFNVSSTDCRLHKREEEEHQRLPIIVSENRMWLDSKIEEDFLVIPNQKKVILSCQSQDSESNSFQILPGTNEIAASCVGEDKFLVNGKIYKYPELQCDRAIIPSLIRTGEQCLNKDTEMLQIGYQLKEFTEVYRVCFDVVHKVPLYSRLTNINYNKVTSSVPQWYIDSKFELRTPNSYTCKTPSSTCCIGEEQLVNAEDIVFGAAQRSTFIKNINTVPSWRACVSSRMDWAAIEEQLVQQTDKIAVWSGASQYSYQSTLSIPQYLWKVVKFSDENPLAIIYVNDKDPDDSKVLCRNVCPPGGHSWVVSSDKYTYCCELRDFITAFNIPENVFNL